MAQWELRDLLMGTPLTERDAEGMHKGLNVELQRVVDFLPEVYGPEEATRQAQLELRDVIAMPETPETLSCRRAAVLFAMGREPEVARQFGEGEFVQELQARVLPITLPRFLRHSCQAPDTFVTLTMVLAEMWKGEALGNWPRA